MENNKEQLAKQALALIEAARVLIKQAGYTESDGAHDCIRDGAEILADDIKRGVFSHCRHTGAACRFVVGSPIDTVEICATCGAKQDCEPSISR